MLVGTKLNPQINFPASHQTNRKRIAIVGGGLAGASLAFSLSKRGAEISIFEQKESLFTGASGNERGVIMPQLSSIPDAQCRFFLAGFLYTIRLLKALDKESPISSLSQKGVIRYCNVAKWQSVYNKLEELGLDKLARKLELKEINALEFIDGTSVSPSGLGQRLLEEAGQITIKTNSNITCAASNKDGACILIDGREYIFDAVVCAAAYGSAFIENLSWVPIEKIKGELGIIRTPDSLPQKPMCYDGYTVPLPDNKTLIGATYEHNTHDETPSFLTTKSLYSRLQKLHNIPDLEEDNYEGGRVCFRTTSPDRLPVIGPTYQTSNVYLSVGHGSRGLVSAPLSAELISQMIFNEPLSIEMDLLMEILPERYPNRAKRKEKSLEEIYPASFVWRS